MAITAINTVTDIQIQRLRLIFELDGGVVDFSREPRRTVFNAIFSGGGEEATTRANLLALWRRQATVAEAVFATGTGTTGSPGLLVVRGGVTLSELQGL